MTTPSAVHAAVLAALKALPNLTVYDAEVPDRVPADQAGKALPYVVVMPGIGAHDPYEATLDATPGEVEGWTQITCASGYVQATMRAAEKVRAALAGRWVGGVLLREDLSSNLLAKDTTTTPPRYYVPLRFDFEL